VPRKLKKEVADDLRSIFYASSKNKALEFFEHFKKKWKNTIPSAVSCLKRSINPNNSLLYQETQNTVVSRLLVMILNNFIVNSLKNNELMLQRLLL